MNFYAPFTDELFEEKPETYSVRLNERPPSSEKNKSFEGNFQFVWDSVSSGHLKTCPRKYYYSLIEGWTFKVKPVKMAFGIAFHTCQEVFQHCLAHGLDKPTTLLRVVRLAGLLGERLPEGPNSHTKETLIRAVVWYNLHFWDDKATPILLEDGTPAVEYDARFPFVEINGVQTHIIVHLDAIVEFHSQLWFLDHKTSTSALDQRFFYKFPIDNQMRLYNLAANVTLDEPVVGGIIDAVQIGVNYIDTNREMIEWTPEQNQEFINDFAGWLSLAAYYAETNTYPQNEAACTHYGGCPFIPVCSKPASRREAVLKTNFTRRPWDPTVRRDT